MLDGTLVVDEVQRAPELFLPLKASVDRNRRPGRFVLTGSSDLLRSAPDSLAGRAVTLDGYVERLLGRDLNDIAPRVDSARVARVLRLIAANQSGEFVTARIARDAGMPEASVRAYADALSALYIVDSLPPWTPNLTSRESSQNSPTGRSWRSR